MKDVKTHTTYECEICERRFNSADAALKCEAQGAAPIYPIGLLSQFHYGANFAFALAECRPQGHYIMAGLWACRDNRAGDSLGEELCGSGHFYDPETFDPAWLKTPPMQRLISWLRSQNITPMVWIEGKAIPLDEVSK